MERLATQADLDARVLAAARTEVRVAYVPPPQVVVPADTPVPTIESVAVSDEPEAPNWPDEASETAFLADARERGEPVAPTPKPVEDLPEPTEASPLPSLDSLVERIPADVRDTLETLFRAKFIRVQRVPKRALKK